MRLAFGPARSAFAASSPTSREAMNARAILQVEVREHAPVSHGGEQGLKVLHHLCTTENREHSSSFGKFHFNVVQGSNDPNSLGMLCPLCGNKDDVGCFACTHGVGKTRGHLSRARAHVASRGRRWYRPRQQEKGTLAASER